MKIIKFLGGLGNQMFQYAFYKSLQNRGIKVYADLSDFEEYPLHNGYELENIFNLKVKIPNKFLLELFRPDQSKWIFRKLKRILNLKNTCRVEESEFNFDASFLNNTNNYYSGYWQNEGYFRNIADKIKHEFIFPKIKEIENQTVLQQILNTESVSIHIRRGDYLKDPLLGNICDLNYYEQAISIINLKVKNPRYFVFSDDIVWCRQNLKLQNITYIDWNDGRNSYLDMQLMSNCKHNIIANSSFSWWGAWLNNNGDKLVIAPKKWVNNINVDDTDICPKSWIKI
ncbi:alpha-1,2-fucosyltransferase [uncultured Pedobacter sp.]|uniref:alpha-1,2-fucosyltransferase n=1 Tax=uncultured Pedobacter sp. TaxID=246139 RepID=UPI0025DD7DC3|nr:alpha-1,2-fucosyltransferase [uncultured Pedobacter sp.]